MAKLSLSLIVGILGIILAVSSLGYTYLTVNGINETMSSLKDSVDALTEIYAPSGLQTLLGAKREGKIVFYCIYLTRDLEVMKKAFEAKYPFITLEYYRVSSPVQLMEKYLAEVDAGRVNCDIIQLTDPSLMIDLKNSNLLSYYESPEYANYPDYAQDYGYWMTTHQNFVNPIGYNTIDGRPITSYLDLLNASLKGKIGLDDYRFSGTGAQIYYLLRNKLGPGFWQSLGQQQCQLIDSSVLLADKLSSGELTYVLGLLQSRYYSHALTGAPINLTWPQEGTVFTLSPLGIVANPPHPNAARVFFDWLQGPEFLPYLASMGLYSLRNNAPSPTELPSIDELRPQLLVVKNWTDLIATRETYRHEFADYFGVPYEG